MEMVMSLSNPGLIVDAAPTVPLMGDGDISVVFVLVVVIITATLVTIFCQSIFLDLQKIRYYLKEATKGT